MSMSARFPGCGQTKVFDSVPRAQQDDSWAAKKAKDYQTTDMTGMAISRNTLKEYGAAPREADQCLLQDHPGCPGCFCS
jgi:hypothetical protein